MALSARDIITVTQGGILYRDKAEVVRWIDFVTCYETWMTSHPGLTSSDTKYVGWRNTGDVLDVEFFTEPRTRFEFLSYQQRDSALLDPMREMGWYTWDATR